MTKTAYAARRGVSAPMVSKWIKAGRVKLTADGRLVDVDASDRVLAATLDPSRGGKNGKSVRAPVKRKRGRPTGNRSAKGLPHYDRERTRQQTFDADRARTRHLKEIGELVPRSQAMNSIVCVAAATRAILNQTAPRHGALGASKLDVDARLMIIWLEGVMFEVGNEIADEIRRRVREVEPSRWVDEKTRLDVEGWYAETQEALRRWEERNDRVPRSNGARDGGTLRDPAEGDGFGVERGNEAARR